MRRLYLQIYLTIAVILVIATLAIGLMGRFAFDEARFDDMITVAGELAVNALPPPDGAFWNAPFGAYRTWHEVADAHQALGFLRDGHAALSR